MFCCEVEFDRRARRGRDITIALQRLQGQVQHKRYELAVQRIRNWKGDEVASDFTARVQRTRDRKDARAAAAPKVNAPIADRWREADEEHAAKAARQNREREATHQPRRQFG